jgi:hypothetical protein
MNRRRFKMKRICAKFFGNEKEKTTGDRRIEEDALYSI